MSDYVFVNKKTGRQYKVVEFDEANHTVTLVGEFGRPIIEPYSKERFEKLGYKLQPA